MLRCDWLVLSSCDSWISIIAVSMYCSLGGPLAYGSPVVVFLDRGHPCFRIFYSTIAVDVVRVKSHVNRLFDLAYVPMRITIRINFTSFQNGLFPVLLACFETWDVSFMFFDSILRRSFSFADVDFTAFTGNPINPAILFTWPDSVFRSY